MENSMTNYLKDVSTLECQLYTQNRLLNQLKVKAESLGFHKTYEKPEISPWSPPIGRCIFGAFQAIIWTALLIGLVSFIRADYDNIFIYSKKFIPVVILFVEFFCLFLDYKEHISSKKTYEKKMQKYNEAVNADEQRVKKELLYKKELIAQWYQVKEKRDETNSVLLSIYDVGIIHEKYRNIVAVTSFYDYFDTGQCFSLTGPGGAYARYEEDLRFKRIETRLDVIINKLDEIIANQQYIASLMQEANNTLKHIETLNNSMMSDMKNIKENSELTAYNTRCSAQSSAVMEHIMIYQTLKNR